MFFAIFPHSILLGMEEAHISAIPLSKNLTQKQYINYVILFLSLI